MNPITVSKKGNEMQDIVFYVVASETGGMLRDYANVHTLEEPPALTLGVSVCLRMRLFASLDDTTPYSVDSFSGISSWQWSMGADFDRTTGCKLVADAESISVHTVTDTIKGETATYTEFVIPISNMNTEELAAWLGNAKRKTGLTGELIGCDNGGHAAFVLQIDGFSVRNRVSGLEDPTAMDQEIVTRPVAEQMIQATVSASAATKQDKLNSANAGTGISVTSSGIISTVNVPQSAVAGLSASLAAKQDNITAGYRMALVSGSTVDQARYFAIEPAITAPANQTTTVVLSAGKAYEIHAVANNAKVLLTRENPVGGSRTFGLEGHAEIFVANTGYIQTGANVVLSQPLEPDTVNNCTLRFHDGKCIISVEDHIAGYIVTVASGSTVGSLPYALHDISDEYIAFDASLNGTTVDLAGATTYAGEKHVVGNGYAETIISGGITCTSKTTFSNLSMDGVVASGGTMTLSDVYIPSGATVAVNGGGLAVEKVNADGGTIDLGGTNIVVSSFTAYISGATITGFAAGTGVNGAVKTIQSGHICATSCTFSGNDGTYGPAVCAAGGSIILSGCSVYGNAGTTCEVYAGGSATILRSKESYLEQRVGLQHSATFEFVGNNTLKGIVSGVFSGQSGFVTLASGTTLDLRGNSNPTPINPGGSITFEAGGATVLYSSGVVSGSYTIDNITFNSGTKLTNTNEVTIGGDSVISGSALLQGVKLTRITGGMVLRGTNVLTVSDCTIETPLYTDTVYGAGGTITLKGGVSFSAIGGCYNTISSYGSGAVIISSGAVIDLAGVNAPVPIAPGGGITIPAGAIVTIVGSGGSSGYFSDLTITGTTITNLGRIYGATVTVPPLEDGGDRGPWDLETTEGTSTVSAVSGQSQEIVVQGGLISIIGQ